MRQKDASNYMNSGGSMSATYSTELTPTTYELSESLAFFWMFGSVLKKNVLLCLICPDLCPSGDTS